MWLYVKQELEAQVCACLSLPYLYSPQRRCLPGGLMRFLLQDLKGGEPLGCQDPTPNGSETPDGPSKQLKLWPVVSKYRKPRIHNVWKPLLYAICYWRVYSRVSGEKCSTVTNTFAHMVTFHIETRLSEITNLFHKDI